MKFGLALLLVACAPAPSAPALPSPAWSALGISLWTAESDEAGSGYGAIVAPAGDVDGDGHDDVLVGAPYAGNGAIREGRAYLYRGTPTGPEPLPAWTAESDQDYAQFGLHVASAGDVNGDGFDDVAVGAPYYDNGEINEGRAFVYLGSPAGLEADASWTAESDRADVSFGRSASGAGDVDGDGFDDLVVGECGLADEGPEPCRASVFHGSAAGLEAEPRWTVRSDEAGSMFGFEVAAAGDVDADGFDDVLVGAYLGDSGDLDEGLAFLYRGSSGGLEEVAAWVGSSDDPGARFGVSVAAAGDVNGDGFGDVVIGADLADGAVADEGRAYVFHGSPNGLGLNPAWTVVSGQAAAMFAHSAAAAGDLDGDGYGDVIVGAYGYDGALVGEGRIEVYLGSPSGLATTPWWSTGSFQANAGLGLSVASAGDVDADGIDDLLAGAWLFDNGEVDEGRVYVALGTCADHDADGACEPVDPDDDGDGALDAQDSAPLDPLACGDSDQDACEDCLSGALDPAADGDDTDADGTCDLGDPDDDGDGVLDASDLDPLDPNVCGDDDADGCDDCDPSEQADADGDGACDADDPAAPAGEPTDDEVADDAREQAAPRGCGCATAPGGDSPGSLASGLAIVWIARRRARVAASFRETGARVRDGVSAVPGGPRRRV